MKTLLIASVLGVLGLSAGEAAEYRFDPRMFEDAQISPQLLEQFNAAQFIAPGTYLFDVYVNDVWWRRRHVEIHVDDLAVAPALAPKRRVVACMSNALLLELGLAARVPEDDLCADIAGLFEGALAKVDIELLRVHLSIPQRELKFVPRGAVDRADLDAGITALALNYMGNYHVVQSRNTDRGAHFGGGVDRFRSAYLALDAGLNWQQWQFRQQRTLSYLTGSGFSSRALRSYVQRPLLDWESQLSVGQIFTSGRLLSGVSFTGLQLRTDERMLPESQLGFAPVVRGVAETNAKVTIRQNGYEIYQITVAPGAFEIRDLYPTSLSGDLHVEIAESDGRVKSFVMPFSAVPQSLREGAGRYELAVGRTRNTGQGLTFADLAYSRGLSNVLTANAGLRVAAGYHAVVFGGVMNTTLGALGADISVSSLRATPSMPASSGWKAHLAFSRTFEPTRTTLTLAGYRYSSAGYRELADVAAMRAREAGFYGDWPQEQQKHRFDVHLNQAVGTAGSLYLSALRGSYRSGRGPDTQLQLGYSHTFARGVSLNVTWLRQRQRMPWGPLWGTMSAQSHRPNNAITVALSLPLETLFRGAPEAARGTATNASLSTSATRSSRGGTHVQTTYSATDAQHQNLSYSVSAARGSTPGAGVLSANTQWRHALGTLGVNASASRSFVQAGLSTQGALVLHAGGVTFGPYVGETYALLEAPGAEGAQVWGGQFGRINRAGFGLAPSITPYRYNAIALDAQGMVQDYELLTSERRVAPIAGAAVKLDFETRGGTAVLIHLTRPNEGVIPIGSQVLDEAGEVVGMVGQEQQLYLRANEALSMLQVQWGNATEQSCRFLLDLSAARSGSPAVSHLRLVDAVCD